MTLEEIREEIIRLSGSGKRIAPRARKHGIYTTFTIPGLDDMAAVRDTKQRFDDFGVPQDLAGRTVIDIGCNVGAVSLEFARRGATVVGVEYREDRVALCEMLANHFNLPCKFYSSDLNSPDIGDHWWALKQYDIVWSSSVDEYIVDVPSFYRLLHRMCSDTMYLESNLQGKGSEEIAYAMISEVFGGRVSYKGNGHSGGISRKRKLYVGEVMQ